MKKIDIVQPTAMASIFANDVFSSSGTSDFELPAATSTSTTDTCVMDDGFLPITSDPLPPDGTGIAPERKSFNGMFYLSTDQRVFLQNGGLITYNSDVATAIGGYPKGAVLGYVDSNNNLGFVISLIDDNQYNFITTPSYINNIYWKYAHLNNINADVTTLNNSINTLSAACVKLTGNQSIAGTKTFTGKIVVPNTTAAGTALALAERGNYYIKLGDGTIIQWGDAETIDHYAYVNTYITYTSSYRAFLVDSGGNTSLAEQKVIEYTSLKRFRVYSSSSSSNGDAFHWLTIGR